MIIDSHIHTDFLDEKMIIGSKKSDVDFSEKGLINEMQKNKVIFCISMQISSKNGNLANDFDPVKNYVNDLKNVLSFIAINPHNKDPNQVDKYEALIKTGKIKGIKIYLGYYHFYPTDSAYLPFYRLAEKYNLIVVFHTGDTYSQKAKLKYAHPLNIDEVAVDFPKVKFVMAHMGEPWVLDAAQVLYKNANVYADLSGLAVGNLRPTTNFDSKKVKEALEYCDCYDRILYGSDWPLAPMKPYIKLIKSIIPRKYHKQVFHDNAAKLFGINK